MARGSDPEGLARVPRKEDSDFKEGKVKRLEAWLAARGETLQSYDSSWFYSDSLNDLPLLAVVAHPVAVDPDATLSAHAEAAGWPVISLRPSTSWLRGFRTGCHSRRCWA